jgi:hypothetical protein
MHLDWAVYPILFSVVCMLGGCFLNRQEFSSFLLSTFVTVFGLTYVVVGFMFIRAEEVPLIILGVIMFPVALLTSLFGFISYKV